MKAFDLETPPGVTWRTRAFRVGGVLGLGIAVLGQCLVAWVGHEAEGSGAPLVIHAAAVLASTGTFALVGLLGGVLSSPLLRARRGQALAAGLVSLGLTLAAAYHVMATGVRALSGTLPTLSGLELFVASPSQFFHAALVGHRSEILFLFGSAGGLALGLFLLLVRRPGRSGPHRPRVLMLVGPGLGLVLLLLAAAPSLAPDFQKLVVTCPELTLLGSLENEVLGTPSDLEADALPPPVVPPGPPLSEGEAWLRTARAWRGPKPNVLLILLESLPANHLGYAGDTHVATPNIDRLAAGGLRFHNVWSTAPQSSYAQMAVLSSQLPRRRPWLVTYRRINYPRMLLHDIFHELGYATATVSSQNENWQGMRRFQDTGTPTFYRDSNDHPGPYMGEGEERKLPDHVTVDVFLDWLRGQSGPWSAYVNFQRTHFPYELPPGFTGRHQPSEPTASTFGFLHYPRAELPVVRNRYDNALEYVDAQVGRILRYLEDTGQLDDTLIVLSSDHGEQFYENGLVTHGKTLHEPQVRIPLLIHWPRHVASRDVDVPMSQLDILPTVLELLGLPPHPSFQGQPLSERERPGAHDGIFFTLHGLRAEDGLVCWPWKIVYDLTDHRIMVHDLAEDPTEEHELYAPDRPIPADLVRMLSAQLDAQLDYYSPKGARDERFAPRMLKCPDWSTFTPSRGGGAWSADAAAAP